MVDTLRNLSEAIANLPDNTTELISPQNIREAVYCVTPDRANAAAPPGTVALTGTDWSDLGDLAPVMDESLWWIVDGNGAVVPSYPAGITIQPGHLRTVRVTSLVSIDPSFSGIVEFTLAVSGLAVGDIVAVDTASQVTDVAAALIHDQDLDYSIPEPVTTWVRNPAGGGSVDFNSYSIRTTGAPND